MFPAYLCIYHFCGLWQITNCTTHFFAACNKSFHLLCAKDSDKCPGIQISNEDESPYDVLAKVQCTCQVENLFLIHRDY